MSTDATDPKNAAGNTATETSGVTTSPNNKGKGKAVQEDVPEDEEEDEEEEDDDDDEGEEEDDDDEMEEENFEEIDPSVIRPRRTRGVRVDYTSEEALKKAGLKPGDEEDDEEMKDD